MKSFTAKNIVLNELMANPIGGDINSDACEFIGSDTVIIHCWDGRRFKLTCIQEEDGFKYDAETGNPIV